MSGSIEAGLLIWPFFAGLLSSVAYAPQSPLTSPILNSPNISTARAYICQGSSYLNILTVQNASVNTTFRQKDPPSTIVDIAGNCSDGVQLPAFSYASNDSTFKKTCDPLGYSTLYSSSSRVYTYQDSTYNLSSFGENFTYRQAPQIVLPARVHVKCRGECAGHLYAASFPSSSCVKCQKCLCGVANVARLLLQAFQQEKQDWAIGNQEGVGLKPGYNLSNLSCSLVKLAFES